MLLVISHRRKIISKNKSKSNKNIGEGGEIFRKRRGWLLTTRKHNIH